MKISARGSRLKTVNRQVTSLIVVLLGLLPASTVSAQDAAGISIDELNRALHARHFHNALHELTDFEFLDTPLNEVVDYFRLRHKIPIEIDIRALDASGIWTDTPINKNLGGITLETALRLILRDIGGQFYVDDGVLIVTTQDKPLPKTIRFYPIDDLLNEKEPRDHFIATFRLALTDEPQAATEKDKTQPAQPPSSSITIVRGLLCVRGNSNEHRRIETMLADMRRALKLPLPAHDDEHPLSKFRFESSLDLSTLSLRDDDYPHLRSSKPLQILAIRNKPITEAAIRWIAAQSELRHLDLIAAKIDDRLLKNLSSLQKLETLDLSHTSVSDIGLEHLRDLPSLTSLKLKRVQVKNFSVFKLLRKLNELDLSEVRLKDQDLKTLSELKQLKSLILNPTSISDAQLATLGKFTHLEKLTLNNSRIEYINNRAYPVLSLEAVNDLKSKLPNCQISGSFRGKPILPEFERDSEFEDTFGPRRQIRREPSDDPFSAPPERKPTSLSPDADPFGAPQP